MLRAASLVLIAAVLTGCGLRGELVRPAPLSGEARAGDPPPASLDSNVTIERPGEEAERPFGSVEDDDGGG